MAIFLPSTAQLTEEDTRAAEKVAEDYLGFNPPLTDGINHSGPSRLHWDASIAHPMCFDMLGIRYLNDVATNQGAFRCVPGFHRKMTDWVASLPVNSNPRDEDLEALGVVSVGGNAGDLIIWRQDLPHGSGQNLADKPRIAQYITMYPPLRASIRYGSERMLIG